MWVATWKSFASCVTFNAVPAGTSIRKTHSRKLFSSSSIPKRTGGPSIKSLDFDLRFIILWRPWRAIMDFPIIADLDMKVSKLYGMLHPGESTTAAVRAVFFIDPKGTIRLIMYYPLNVGRNMAEIQRVLIALQTSDKNKVAMPLNWEPREKVIVPPPKNLKEMDAVIANTEYEKVDFYLAKKKLQD